MSTPIVRFLMKYFAHQAVSGIQWYNGSEAVLSRLAQAGIDINALGVQLQDEGIASFVKSWIELMTAIATKGAALSEDQK